LVIYGQSKISPLIFKKFPFIFEETKNKLIMKTKVCTKCKVEKLRTDFNKQKKKKDGLYS